MRAPLNRREFLATSGAAAAGLWAAGCASPKISPNAKLNLGVIGTADRARDDLDNVASENIVALCDVNSNFLDAAKLKYPRAVVYRDFRKMLERNDLDAVVVGTPDHTHAVAAVAALQSGRHVYCEKPLARTISEVRRITETARKYKRVTQMGTQIHSACNYPCVVNLIQSGLIGPVREVHVWIATMYTAVGLPATEVVPADLDWDLWLGPVHARSYSAEYVPKSWRRYWAFGGGTLSDMGCHYIDLVHWALGLRHPISVEAEGPKVDVEGTPEWLIARYEYAARGKQPPVKMTWYHGMRDGQKVRPSQFATGEIPEWGPGVLFVGDKGMLLADYWNYALLPQKDFPPQPKEQHGSPGNFDLRHHEEWIHAIKNGGLPSCNFDYSGPLSEAVLLGNVAYRSGEKIHWDSAALKAIGAPHAEQFIQHQYRAGWSI